MKRQAPGRHSSIGITVDTYGHLSEDAARTASDAMAALEQAFETAAAAARDHTGTTTAVSDTATTGRRGNVQFKTVGLFGFADG